MPPKGNESELERLLGDFALPNREPPDGVWVCALSPEGEPNRLPCAGFVAPNKFPPGGVWVGTLLPPNIDELEFEKPPRDSTLPNRELPKGAWVDVL